MPGGSLMMTIRTVAAAAVFAALSVVATAQTAEEKAAPAAPTPETAPAVTAPETAPAAQQAAPAAETPETAPAEAEAAPPPVDPLFQMIESVPVAITDIRLVGEWSEGDEVGIFRTIVTQDMVLGGASRLFVQWLAPGDTGPRIRHQIEIKELVEERINIVDFTAETDQQGLALYLETVAANGGFSSGFEVFITAPDEYLFQPISN